MEDHLFLLSQGPCFPCLALYLVLLPGLFHCQADALLYGVLYVFHSVSPQSPPAQQESLDRVAGSAAAGTSSCVSSSVSLACHSQDTHGSGAYICAYVSLYVPLGKRQELLDEVFWDQAMTLLHEVMERVRDVP